MSELEELILRIEHGKHDITMRIRSIVLDPIEAMNAKEAASPEYFTEQGDTNRQIQVEARAIMAEFSKKWRNVKSPMDEQLAQMQSQLAKITTEFVPRIKRIVSFYALCIKHKNYFGDSENGNWALGRMTKAAERVGKVCTDLAKIGGDASIDSEGERVNLLEVLQEILDDIMADVIYDDEYRLSTIEINTDKDIFQNHVLLNIQENISKHAFGTQAFKKKHIWERIVFVSVEDFPDRLLLRIANNGSPFKGKPEKVFDYGYCHGENKHSGVGMNSAQNYMKQLGGDIRFESTPDSTYKVTFILELPK